MTLERELSPDTSLTLTNKAGTYAHGLPTLRYGHWTHFCSHWSFLTKWWILNKSETKKQRLKFPLSGAG